LDSGVNCALTLQLVIYLIYSELKTNADNTTKLQDFIINDLLEICLRKMQLYMIPRENNFKECYRFFLRIPSFTTCLHLTFFCTFLPIKIHSFQYESTQSQILHEGEVFPHADFATGYILIR